MNIGDLLKLEYPQLFQDKAFKMFSRSFEFIEILFANAFPSSSDDESFDISRIILRSTDRKSCRHNFCDEHDSLCLRNNFYRQLYM